MLNRIATCILTVLLAFAFTSTSFAQDSKKDVKKETKPAVVKDAKKEMKKPGPMKYVSCSQAGCGLWAKSHSGKELRSFMKKHAKKYHKMELTDKQLKEMVKVEGAK